jgi:hypothetical protein
MGERDELFGLATEQESEHPSLALVGGTDSAEPVRQQRLVDAELLGDEALAQPGFLDGVGERLVGDVGGRLGHDGWKATTNHSRCQVGLTDDGWVARTDHSPTPLREVISQSGVGDREIARRILDAQIPNSRGGVGYSHTQIVHAKNGADGSRAMRPRPELIEAICQVIGFPPEAVAEYQLWQVRQLFDEQAIGMPEALANLERYGFVSTDGRKGGALEAQRLAERAGQRRAGKPQRTRKSRAVRDAESGQQ